MRRAFLATLCALPFALGAQAPAAATPLTPEQLISQRRFDEVKPTIDAMLARDRNDPHALYLMGRLVYQQGKSGEAVDWFEKAIKRDETKALYHTWLGNALGDETQKANKLRQPFLARRVKSEFERAVALDSTAIDPREGLVDFYSMAPGIMGGSMEKAKAQAAEITKLNPIRGNLKTARVAEREKDFAAAERAYKSVIEAAPDSTQGYYAIGAFYRGQSRWDDAFTAYETLLKRKPDEVTAHLTWGGTAAASGRNLERGETELKFYLENAPKDAPVQNQSSAHWRLGQIYEKTRRKEQARAEYTEAVRLNPQNQNAKKSLEELK